MQIHLPTKIKKGPPGGVLGGGFRELFGIKKGRRRSQTNKNLLFTKITYFQRFFNDFLKTLGKERRSSTFLSEVGWSHQVSMLLPSTK